jgi:hypothetical protein
MPDRYGDTPNDTPDEHTPTAAEIIAYQARVAAALQIGCRHCHAKPGQPCTSTIHHRPLRRQLTHPIRITDTKTVIPLPTIPDDDPEELF